MSDWNDLEKFLDASGNTSVGTLPPPGEALRQAIAEAGAASPRRPARRALVTLGLGLAQVALLTNLLGFRRDLEELPRVWVISYIGAWILGFAVLAWGTQVPKRGHVMSRTSLFGPLGLLIAAAFTVGGVAFARHVPGLSTMYEPSVANVIAHAPYCMVVGLSTSILPLIAAGLLLRGAAPRGGRLLGAAVGASSGALGGLVLHLHCPIAEGTHLGLVHGGVLLIAAALGALALPLLTRIRA